MEQLAQRVEAPTMPQEEVSEPAGKVTTTTYESAEKPLEPGYLNELWKIGEAVDHFKMPTLTAEIDAFVMSTIERENLEKNRKSYEEIIERYEKKVNLPENVDVYTKTERIAELMRIDQKLLDALREKEEFMNKPPTEMSSKELKRFIKERI